MKFYRLGEQPERFKAGSVVVQWKDGYLVFNNNQEFEDWKKENK